jgi:hypothetical protein
LFENRVVRRTFGLKREEVRGSWRRLHNEEFHDLYASPNIITVTKLRRMRWVGHAVCMRHEKRYTVLVGKSEGKRPLGRTKSR